MRLPTPVSTTLLRSLCALLALLPAVSARAADLQVLTAGAYKPVLAALLPGFEAQTGHRVRLDNDTAGALVRRVAAGEAFDLLVLTPGAFDSLAANAGPSRPPAWAGTPLPLARVAIGVAVPAGAPRPDIASVAALQRTLLAARAVATIDPVAGGSSGIYLWQLFERWGLAAQLRPRAVLVPGGLVAQRLLTGEADIALHQISEILAVPGVQLVGPLPAEVQNHTVYAAAVAARPRDAATGEAAQALLAWLRGPAAAAVLQAKGMEAP